MNERPTLYSSVKVLLSIWAIGPALVMLILGYRTVTGRYEGNEDAIWSWALPHFMPTTSLLGGSLLFLIAKQKSQMREIDPFLLKLTVSGSVFYLALLLLIVALHGFLPGPTLQTFKRATFALAPMQSLVVAFVGAFTISTGPGR